MRLGLQTFNLGSCGAVSLAVPKETSCADFLDLVTMRVQAQGKQLHQAHLQLLCAVEYLHMRFFENSSL